MANTYIKAKIYKDILARGSEKAFFVEISNGYWMPSDHHKDPIVWIPRRLCVISEPNDVGWCDVRIPMWLFTNNRYDPHRCIDINIQDIVYE